jgi:nitrogen fixation protein NifZ
MSNIVRDSDVVEISEPPYFSFGEKVKAKRIIRNDGTYAGKEIGEILAKKGEIGYVVSIGTFCSSSIFMALNSRIVVIAWE